MKVVKKLSASIHYSVHNGIKRVTLSAIYTVPYGIFIRKHKMKGSGRYTPIIQLFLELEF